MREPVPGRYARAPALRNERCLGHAIFAGRAAGAVAGIRVVIQLVVVIRFVVIGVIAALEVRVSGIMVRLLIRTDAQLSPQPVKVSPAAAILQLTGHLDLLGLGSAAPHWLDPLERTGPAGPLVTALSLLTALMLAG